jgi:DNA gyrase subunit A
MRLVEKRGGLAGALVCAEEDEIFAIASNGVVIRTRVDEIRAAGRDTMGVGFMKVGDDEQVVAVARSSAAAMAELEELNLEEEVVADEIASDEAATSEPEVVESAPETGEDA